MSRPPEADILWTNNHIASLAIGGTWAVPRDGLIFRRASRNCLVLIATVPWSEEMRDMAGCPKSKMELVKFQEMAYQAIKERATAFIVSDARTPAGGLQDAAIEIGNDLPTLLKGEEFKVKTCEQQGDDPASVNVYVPRKLVPHLRFLRVWNGYPVTVAPIEESL